MTTDTRTQNPSAPAVDNIVKFLSNHPPEIRARGCTIHMGDGYLVIAPWEAAALADAVEQLLISRLRLELRAARDEGIATGANVCGGAA